MRLRLQRERVRVGYNQANAWLALRGEPILRLPFRRQGQSAG